MKRVSIILLALAMCGCANIDWMGMAHDSLESTCKGSSHCSTSCSEKPAADGYGGQCK